MIRKVTFTFLASWIASLGFAPAAEAKKIQYGKVILKTGQVLEADVALEIGENYILRDSDGLRILSKSVVENVVPASAESSGDPGLKSLSKSKNQGRLWPGGPKKTTDSGGPKKAPEPRNPAAPSARDSVNVQPDDRLDAARSSGKVPVMKISLGGTINGKPLEPTDAFALSRLTYFFEEQSRPRFQVIQPPGEESGKKEASSPPPADYLARFTTETAMKQLTFYGTEVLKKFESKVQLQVIRASDKKVVVEIIRSDDIGGDPERRQESCRQIYEQAVEALVMQLKTLKPFGGSSTGS